MVARRCKKRPKKGQGYDRSSIEQSIFASLKVAGWIDERVIGFADAYRLPRHTQEKQKRQNYTWTLESIKKTSNYAVPGASETSNSSISTPMCMQPDSSQSAVDPYSVLKLVRGQTTSELVRSVMQDASCGERAAYRILRRLELGGHIVTTREGRNQTKSLTDRGVVALNSKFRVALNLPTVDSLGTGDLAYRLR